MNRPFVSLLESGLNEHVLRYGNDHHHAVTTQEHGLYHQHHIIQQLSHQSSEGASLSIFGKFPLGMGMPLQQI